MDLCLLSAFLPPVLLGFGCAVRLVISFSFCTGTGSFCPSVIIGHLYFHSSFLLPFGFAPSHPLPHALVRALFCCSCYFTWLASFGYPLTPPPPTRHSTTSYYMLFYSNSTTTLSFLFLLTVASCSTRLSGKLLLRARFHFTWHGASWCTNSWSCALQPS